MSRSARARTSSPALVTLLAALLVACDGIKAASRGAPGGGSRGAGFGDESGEGGGTSDEGEGGAGGDSTERLDPDDTGIYTGDCEVEGQIHVCVAHNQFGCLQGRQKCIEGEWSSCFRKDI